MSGDGRKDKALTTMPSRLRDKSGHRRKAFLPAPLAKSIQVVAALAAVKKKVDISRLRVAQPKD
mgnify:CR=1 FL=1